MLWLKSVRVVDPSQALDDIRDVLIRSGRIAALQTSLSESEVQDLAGQEELEIIDGQGKILFPGLIDVHTHLREPGYEDKEDILSGSRAAVRGGFTSILAMPNTKPVIDHRSLVEFVVNQGQRAGKARVYPIGALSKGLKGEELTEMVDMAQGGAVAFSDDGRGIQNSRLMRLAFEYSQLTAKPVICHCEDEDLAEGGSMHRGERSALLGLKGIPSSAEAVMVYRDLLLAEETGAKLHLAHISCKESVELIRRFKAKGLEVTAEVNPHHLIFCDEDITLTQTSLKVNPPLRGTEDRQALIEALIDGTIDMLATDHAPHTWEEKVKPFGEAPFGIMGLETALSAVWQHLVLPGRLSITRLVEAWSTLPAKRFNLPGGSLQVGAPADMVLFDPDYEEVITPENLESKAQNTPFLNQTLKGMPVMTWVGGKLVMKNRQVLD